MVNVNPSPRFGRVGRSRQNPSDGATSVGTSVPGGRRDHGSLRATDVPKPAALELLARV
jgi:hypothetical protein